MPTAVVLVSGELRWLPGCPRETNAIPNDEAFFRLRFRKQ